jgi:signal transduction histidine kinase
MRRVIPVTDVAGDPLMEEFHEAYFRPLGIGAMLDAPIYQAGEVAAIVCHELVGPARSWTQQDCELAATVAEVIARLHEEAARHRVERERDTYQEQIAELQRLGDLGRLAAGMAHDFNNILQAIVGYAETIADATREQVSVRPLVQGLMGALDRGAHLMNELRALGRTRASRPRVIDLVACMKQMGDLLAKAAGPTITLGLNVGAETAQVFIDPSLFERALLNLVMNARDATPSGGTVTLAVTEGSRTDQGHEGKHFCDRRRDRHWRRHGPGNPNPDVRAPVHDQRRQRHGSRPFDRSANRHARRRIHRGQQRLGCGHQRPPVFSEDRLARPL